MDAAQPLLVPAIGSPANYDSISVSYAHSRRTPRMRRALVYVIGRSTFAILWLIINAGIVIYCYNDTTRNTIERIKDMSKHSILLSFAAILLLMSPTLLTVFRNFLSSRTVRFEKHVYAHKVAACTLFVWTAIHIVIHYNHYIGISKPRTENGKHIDGTPLIYSLFIMRPGWTGHLMLVSLIAMCSVSYAPIRRQSFELFYYTHHLFALYAALLFIHGRNVFVRWYLTIPLIVYFTDRLYRSIRTVFNRTQLYTVIQHPAGIIELRLSKGNFKLHPGQYLRICCPSVSVLQWHPVTITSASDDKHISLHLRVEGSWTCKLAQHFGCDFGEDPHLSTAVQPISFSFGDSSDQLESRDQTLLMVNSTTKRILPHILVDGPYYSPFQHALDYEVTVMVAAGIGITPVASVLRSLCLRHDRDDKIFTTNVIVVWAFRDIGLLNWLCDLISTLKQEEYAHIVDIHLYYTGKDPVYQIPNMSLKIGRPTFGGILEDIVSTYPASQIGVFVCGPRSMAKVAENEAKKWDNIDFYSEHFC